MIGFKVSLFLLSFVLIAWEVDSSSSSSSGGSDEDLQVCPDCEPQLTDTLESYALRYINGDGPRRGKCLGSGAIEWVFKGKDYNAARDACCCLIPPSAPAVTCPPKKPVVYCPDIINPIRSETLATFYMRIGSELNNPPTNGCCKNGSYKVVFDKSLTGTTNDVCVCINQKKFKVLQN